MRTVPFARSWMAIVASKYQLLEPHIPSLRRYARALVRDADRADDLVQDSLVRAMSRWHLWRRRGSLRTWLFTILHNVHVNAVRREALRSNTVGWDGTKGGAVPPDQEETIHMRDIAGVLARLPDEQRKAVLLVGLEGFSYEEAARIADVPVGTIMSRLARGRERLRRMMAESDDPPIRRVK